MQRTIDDDRNIGMFGLARQLRPMIFFSSEKVDEENSVIFRAYFLK